MSSPSKKIVIIGGGITGLSAAYYTKKFFQEQQIPVDISIIEKSEEMGGSISTLHRDGFVIERAQILFWRESCRLLH